MANILTCRVNIIQWHCVAAMTFAVRLSAAQMQQLSRAKQWNRVGEIRLQDLANLMCILWGAIIPLQMSKKKQLAPIAHCNVLNNGARVAFSMFL